MMSGNEEKKEERESARYKEEEWRYECDSEGLVACREFKILKVGCE